ncbi:hypothetical protein T459_17716 [Capsicum annuum]|uniref:Uncharacterized protein n=1 Tax=Capsicum annuum TaxID=4072 RepID=A0A2G2ZCI7_CAPAN|nr:hypothetical protein T459_17716 [Capsicum annuum]
MESEFIALDKAGEEAEWLRNFLEDIPYWPKPVAPSKDNVSGPLTKGLSREGVERTSKGMGLRPKTSQHGEMIHCSELRLHKVAMVRNDALEGCNPSMKRHTDS